jgi:argininosuccinate synthase
VSATRVLTTLEEIKGAGGRILVLYSGGLDGSFFLDWGRRNGLDMLAAHVCTGDTDPARARRHAAVLGVPLIEAEVRDRFHDEYVAAAIRGNAYYQGRYPVGSSLTRPLMAETAAELARKHGCQVVLHTATYMQNTASRLTLGILALDPDLVVAAPFLSSAITREDKLLGLAGRGLDFPDGVYSIDANPWARVIECGTLEDPRNPLPEIGVFSWTRDAWDTPGRPADLTLTFRDGLPVACEDEEVSLRSLVARLNQLGGRYGVGRFSGLEDVAFGVKNHEIREAPAAHVITTAHRALEGAVLSERELTLKAHLDNEWTNLIVSGHWHSRLARSVRAFADMMSAPVEGRVGLRLDRGSVTVRWVDAPASLSYPAFGAEFHAVMADFSIASALRLRALTDAPLAADPVAG